MEFVAQAKAQQPALGQLVQALTQQAHGLLEKELSTKEKTTLRTVSGA